jgi:hypothetical protein
MPDIGGVKVILPDGELLTDVTSYQFDTAPLEDGQYEIQIYATDKAENVAIKTISFFVDHNIIDSQIPIFDEKQSSEQNYLLIIGITIGIAIGVISVLFATKKIQISSTS